MALQPYICDFISSNGEPCDKNYSTNRPENLKRHIDEHHLGIKQKCECGKEMTYSSLIRHKKNKTCRKSNEEEINHVSPVSNDLIAPNGLNSTEPLTFVSSNSSDGKMDKWTFDIVLCCLQNCMFFYLIGHKMNSNEQKLSLVVENISSGYFLNF